MSHYANYVLVSNNTVDINEKVELLLSEYSEKPSASEYVGMAMRLLEPVLAEKFGTEGNKTKEALRSVKREIRRTAKTFDQGTENPAKLDWWEVGGRWSGILTQAIRGPVNEDDIVPVASLDLEKVPAPFAIITPDGAWHAQGDMGWFASVPNLDENWEAKAKALLAEHTDAVLVVVDCHI